MWLDYVKQKKEGQGLENYRERWGGGGGGGRGGSWMYEAGKTAENPNANRLALRINKNFTDFIEKFEKHSDRIISCKFNNTEKHHYKSYKSMPLQVTMTTKQWRCSTKNLKKLWTGKPAAIT